MALSLSMIENQRYKIHIDVWNLHKDSSKPYKLKDGATFHLSGPTIDYSLWPKDADDPWENEPLVVITFFYEGMVFLLNYNRSSSVIHLENKDVINILQQHNFAPQELLFADDEYIRMLGKILVEE